MPDGAVTRPAPHCSRSSGIPDRDASERLIEIAGMGRQGETCRLFTDFRHTPLPAVGARAFANSYAIGGNMGQRRARPLNIGPGFRGNVLLLYGLAAFALFFVWVVFYMLFTDPRGFDGGVIPVVIISSGATWVYWWWHERRPNIEYERLMAREVAREPKIEPPKNRPPTAEESKLAVGRMRAALSYVDNFLASKEPDADLRTTILLNASREVVKARNLDPNATVTTKASDDTPLTYDLDGLAATIMFYEADAFLREARNAKSAMWEMDDMAKSENPKEFLADYHERRDEIYDHANQRALAPALKLIAYKPDSPLYLRILAEVYRNLNRGSEADALIKKAYDIDPDDVETIKMMP